MCNSIAVEGIDECLSHVSPRVGFRELDKVKDGCCGLSIPDPSHKNVHICTVIGRGPAVELVCKETLVALCVRD